MKLDELLFRTSLAHPVNAGLYMAFKHCISFETCLAVNFGFDRFRIVPDIVSKLLRAAICSRFAVLSNPSRRPFLRQVVNLYLLLCTGFDSEHVVLTSATHWSGSRVQVWVKVRAHASHLGDDLAITPEGYSWRQSKVLTAKSMGELLGPRSSNAWAGRTREHKHKVFPSWRQSLRAATGSLEQNMLPLLRYWLSLRVKRV